MEFNKKSSDADLGTESPKSRNNTLTYVFVIAMAVLGLLFGILGFIKAPGSLEKGFKEKFNKGDVVEGYAEYGVRDYLMDYSHSINGIRLVHEYYFVITSEDQRSAVLVRAPKKFGEKFDENMEANELVRIKGKVRTLRSDVRNGIGSFVTNGASSGVYVESDVYVDLLSFRINFLLTVLGAGNLILLICMIMAQKKVTIGEETVKAHKGAAVAALFLFLLCGIILLYLVMILL